jgi:hypothetical protein
MELTRRQMTNVPDAHSVSMRAPVNQFAHARAFPRAESREVVRFNFDTLYSMAWLDLRHEPVVLSLPETDRYCLVPVYDMWTDIFAVPGTRTTGGRARDFALVSPDWAGELPDDVELIRSPTPVAWIIGRTQTNGPDDYQNVHRIQDGYRLTPLSAWGQEYVPPSEVPTEQDIDDTTPPLDQVNAMSGVEFFTRLADLLKIHPPHPNDYPIVHRMQALGLRPGQDFAVDALDADVIEAINAAPQVAQDDIRRTLLDGSLGTIRNGWSWGQNLGTYGTSYRLRALVTFGGLGANLPEDAIYPNAFADANGEPFSGTHDYVLHFDEDELPAVDAFWSLTMYDGDGFQVANPIDRFVIRDRDQFNYNADGSLDFYLQHTPPSPDKEANWLPAPSGPFAPMLRLYSPRGEVLRGSLNPPPIKRTAPSIDR